MANTRRENRLEELGRVEAKPSNRNRRAEVRRVHHELNRGLKGGGIAKKGKRNLRDEKSRIRGELKKGGRVKAAGIAERGLGKAFRGGGLA